MRQVILALSSFLLWLPACADPKCPPDYILNQGRCKRCPEGSEAHSDVCVNEGGVIVSHAQTDDDEGGPSTNASNADGSGPVTTNESGSGSTASPTPQPNDGGSSNAEAGALMSMDASTSIASDGGTTSSDSGAAAMIDPCQGIAGCTACTNDAQCPDPGACLVKHCNTAKSICEPTFAPAQAACGTSKCDGAGKCVGCLSDNDCGEPGECKVRYCNPGTRVCEPKNAASTTTCPRGHCNQGACVECGSVSECADQACQTKSCVSGQCRYVNVQAGQKGSCTSGVCTSTQQCAECVGDEHCTRFNGDCSTGRCTNNACRSEAKTGSCGSLKVCNLGTCSNSCNNESIDTASGEQCDSTVAPWTSWTCDSKTCKFTGLGNSAYARRCMRDTDCATNESCLNHVLLAAAGAGSSVCIPKCDGAICRTIPGYTLTGSNGSSPGVCSADAPCFLKCTSKSQCPPNLDCYNQTFCAGPFY